MGSSIKNKSSEENGLLIVRMASHQAGPELEALKHRIIRFGRQQKGDIDILVDVSDVKTSDEAANQFARSFFKDLPFRRMAVYGGSRAVNVGIRLILNLFISMGEGEVKLFKSEEQARKWLGAQTKTG